MSDGLTAGATFGDYRVVRRLGKGGMGEVWLLENASGGQLAAKILTGEVDHESRKRFLREAELALGVKHPNLVEVFDVGEDPDTGLCYILMEYVPGGTLADVIRDVGPLPIADAIAVVKAIALVLEMAREKGIVHRDIKPANIMFGADGTPKLVDLGIARGGLGGTDMTTVTQTGIMIGTPAYMAPEQMLDAHHVDTRADIYSLGVVFFEMLTGQRPNKDDTIVQLMAKAVKGEPLPDVRTLRPEVSASLAQLLNMMVVPNRDGRISTPGQITNALAAIERGGTVETNAEKNRRREAARAAGRRLRKRRRMLLVSVLGALALVGLSGIIVGIWWLSREEERPLVRTESPVGVKPLLPERITKSPDCPGHKATPCLQTEGPSVYAESVAVPLRNPLPPEPQTLVREVAMTNAIDKVVEKPADKVVERTIDDVLNDPVKGKTPLFSTPVDVLPEVFDRITDGKGRFVLHESVDRKLVVGHYNIEAGQNDDGTVKRLRDALREVCAQIGCTFRIIDGTVVIWCDKPGDLTEDPKPKTKTDKANGYEWKYKAVAGGVEITACEDEKAKPACAVEPKPTGTLKIPLTLDGKAVVGIGSWAFVGCKNLKSVEIPEGVLTLRGWGVFFGCEALERVSFPASMKEVSAKETFVNCRSLKVLKFLGPPPRVERQGNANYDKMFFRGASETCVVSVPSAAKGWQAKWPADFDSGRKVVRNGVQDPEEKPVCTPRRVPLARVPTAVRKAFDLHVRDLKKKWYGDENRGCIVYGKLDLAGADPADIATWVDVKQDGTFTLALHPRRKVTFLRHGYEPMVIDVPAAREEFDAREAFDLGTLKMRKLGQGRAGTLQVEISLPAGVPSAKVEIRIKNNSPVRHDWGGCKDTSAPATSLRVKNGQQVVVGDCAAADYEIRLEADGCASRVVKEKVAVGETRDVGVLELVRIRKAQFLIRPFAGGAWTARSVIVDGRNKLLLQDKKDELGNTCDMRVTAYGVQDGIGLDFPWGPDSYVDYGVMDKAEFDRRSKDGSLPDPQNVQFKGWYRSLQVGHVYRHREPSHWKHDLVLAFLDLQEVGGAAAPAAVAPAAATPPPVDNRKIDVSKIKGDTLVKQLQSGCKQLFPEWTVGSDYYSRYKGWTARSPNGYYSQIFGRKHVLGMPIRMGDAPFTVRKKIGKESKLRMSFAMSSEIETCEVSVMVNRKVRVGRICLTETETWCDAEVDLSAYAGKNVRLDIVITSMEYKTVDLPPGGRHAWVLYFNAIDFVAP